MLWYTPLSYINQAPGTYTGLLVYSSALFRKKNVSDNAKLEQKRAIFFESSVIAQFRYTVQMCQIYLKKNRWYAFALNYLASMAFFHKSGELIGICNSSSISVWHFCIGNQCRLMARLREHGGSRQGQISQPVGGAM